MNNSNKKMSENLKLKYEYSKYVYDRERARFIEIEEKTSKFMTLISILIGSIGLFFRINSDIIINLYLGKLLTVISIISLVLFILSLLFSMKVLKIRKTKEVQNSDEMLDCFDKLEESELYSKLSDRFKSAYKNHFEVIAGKVKDLEISYNIAIVGLFFYIGFTIIFLISIFI